jgi:hypothetical protein
MFEILAQKSYGVSDISQVAIGPKNRRKGRVDEAKGMFTVWKLFYVGRHTP